MLLKNQDLEGGNAREKSQMSVFDKPRSAGQMAPGMRLFDSQK
jgi:hypothetical protein